MSEMRENKEAVGIDYEYGHLRPTSEGVVSCIGQLAFDGFETSAHQQADTEGASQKLFPPQERLLIRPGERFQTPVDDRGIVDLRQLMSMVLSFVDGEYEWRGEADRHHLHWFSSLYKHANLFSQNADLSRAFRGLPIHIVWLPKELHAFIHEVTLPVEVPSEEVMAYRNESWNVAYRLFNATSCLLRHRYLPNEVVAQEYIQDLLNAQFGRLEDSIKRAEKLPNEFRFFDTKHAEKVVGARKVSHVKRRDLVRALDDLKQVKRSLGRTVLPLDDVESIAA